MTRKIEEVELVKPRSMMGNYNFKSGDTYASRDRAILNKWVHKDIGSAAAARKICQNNGWEAMSSKDFMLMAHSLGYFSGDYDIDLDD